MAFLLGKKGLHRHRSPEDLVKLSCEQLTALHEGGADKAAEKAADKLARYLGELKVLMLGDASGQGAPADIDVQRLVALDAARLNLPLLLSAKLSALDFEARKDGAELFGAVLRTEVPSQPLPVGVAYVKAHQTILASLTAGYEDSAVALTAGIMLRDCIRFEELAGAVLESPLLDRLFGYVELENFEVASDAFQTLKDLLTRHKKLVADYMLQHYESFFQLYGKLLASENYVTRRQSLKLLGELLLDRHNVKTMLAYVSLRDNLILMMNLMRDKYSSIQFEAFHVFKVFVANPNKPKAITDILMGNKEKMLLFLRDFHSEKDDEQFKEEKAVIMKEISMLGMPPEEQAGDDAADGA
mmetsp:Transcript_14131/g.36270  ORF Transcript_14131/g.36270 Transcript_14131/m.36270 type:complete len:357 (-) Transcript_14131:33-1103(-)|eukprot:jgi/Tetstr1/448464/TSEL_035732.t1